MRALPDGYTEMDRQVVTDWSLEGPRLSAMRAEVALRDVGCDLLLQYRFTGPGRPARRVAIPAKQKALEERGYDHVDNMAIRHLTEVHADGQP